MAASTSPDARCADGGMLVGMDVWLPVESRVRFVGEQELIGCNRLFCRACRSWIRHLDTCSLKAPKPGVTEIERLFVDPRAERSAVVAPSLASRTYLCRCTCVEISRRRPASEVQKSWGCAGHPNAPNEDAVPPPPTESDAQLESLLHASAEGPPAFGDDYPWHFALRWRPAFLFDHVWPVVSKLLVDPDPVIRRRALEFVYAWKPGAPLCLARLIEIATNHANLYQEAALRAELCGALASKAVDVPSQGKAIAKLIVTLLDGDPPPSGAETIVAEFEPEAVIRSVSQWTESVSDRNGAMAVARAMAIFRRDHLLALLRELASRSTAFREETCKAVTNALAIPDDTLKGILENVHLPLPATRPTVDDCRRALGLSTP